MYINEAIERADKERPNLIDNDRKREWVYELEAEYAEMMELEPPVYAAEDSEALLVPFPYDESYVKYLCAKIDYAQEEMQLYADDMMAAEQCKADVKSWWRRHNRPTRGNYYSGVYR